MGSFLFTTFIRTILFVDEIAAAVLFRGCKSKIDRQIVRKQEKQVKKQIYGKGGYWNDRKMAREKIDTV